MPLHEYECTACAHRFELIQKFSDPPADRCPKCGGAVKKLLASPAIQFKGSGWYITDYAKKDQAASAKSDNASTSEAKSETKSETKGDRPETSSSGASSAAPASTAAKD